MVVQHNMTASNTNRMLSINSISFAKSSEKLSSGYRVNRAADDAAGLTISEKMRRQIRGLTQASKNAQEGISAIQIAEGALQETHDMLQRMNELTIKAANGTNTLSDRQAIQQEIDQLISEVDRVSESTEFNTFKLLKGGEIESGTRNIVSNSAGIDGTMENAGTGSATFTSKALNIGDRISIDGDTYEIAASTGPLGNYAKTTLYRDVTLGWINPSVGAIYERNVTWNSYLINNPVVDVSKYYGGDWDFRFTPGFLTGYLDGVPWDEVMTKGLKVNGTTTSRSAYLDVKIRHTAISNSEELDNSKKGKYYKINSSGDYVKAVEGTDYIIYSGSKTIEVKPGEKLEDSSDYYQDEGLTKKATLGDGIYQKPIDGKLSIDDAYSLIRKELEKNNKGSSVSNDENVFTITEGTEPYTLHHDFLMDLFVGADNLQCNIIPVNIKAMDANTLGLWGLNVVDNTGDRATASIDRISKAIDIVSEQRSELGATQNRLEHTIKNLDNVIENTTASESKIRDTDMSTEMVNFTKNNILIQAGQSFLAQCNQNHQGVLALLA